MQDRVVFCRVCGNNLHNECFQKWANSKKGNVTCPYCRSEWKTEQTDKAGYLNLKEFSASRDDEQTLEDLYGERCVPMSAPDFYK